MRKKIVAGNWKMNKSFTQADDLLFEIKEKMLAKPIEDVTVIVCPPFPFLELATDVAEEVALKVGAQNVSQFDEGAYTGETSAGMLQSMDLDYCIVGHSERRKYFKESNEVLAQKVDRLLDAELQPIFCCGELLEEREAQQQFHVVETQLKEALFHLNKDEIQHVVIAYEPVWAIGTGKTASPDQAQEMHAHIRQLLKTQYGPEVADEISILYGGSCNAKNAKELFANQDVDGGLIGGASLKSEDFLIIASSF
jgi:triosephosphate isomerase